MKNMKNWVYGIASFALEQLLRLGLREGVIKKNGKIWVNVCDEIIKNKKNKLTFLVFSQANMPEVYLRISTGCFVMIVFKF